MIMVLMLGAVPVHAQEGGHSHVVEADENAAADIQADLSPDSHPADDRSMHCGAPILGPEPVGLGCIVAVAEVTYPVRDTASPTDLSLKNLRPPRR